jgi:hypothetical protein
MQSVECEDCVHYRAKRRLEQLYKLETTRTSPAIDEIRKRAADCEEEESACLIDLLDTGVPEWPSRPQVLPYCGLREEQNIFLVFEGKNVNHACPDFRSAGSRHGCDTCAHRVEAHGYRDDRNEREELILISRDRGGKDANGNYDSGWRQTRQALDSQSERIDALKMTDMQMALDSGGVTPTRPRYYDRCAKYSGARRYVLCVAHNHDGRCPGHTSASHSTTGNGRRTSSVRSRPLRWEDGGTL